MNEPLRECQYCRRRLPWSMIEERNGVAACRDTEACDRAEEQRHQGHIRDLRKRQRDGDELTDAEKRELSEA